MTTALLAARTETGVSVDLVLVAVAALVLLFACWWLYFLDSDAARLEEHRERSFVWGYGHFFVFAALAAIGAGIEVTVEAISHEVAASPLLVAYSVAIPLAVFLAARYVLYVRVGGRHLARRELIAGEVAIVLAIPFASALLSPVWVFVGLAAAAAGLVAFKTVWLGRVSQREVVDTGALSAVRHDAAHEVAEVPGVGQGRAPEATETEITSAS
jgi:low temperature requirement protein LtrA